MMTYDLRMTEVGPLLEGVASEFREECRLRGLEVILQLQPSCPLPMPTSIRTWSGAHSAVPILLA